MDSSGTSRRGNIGSSGLGDIRLKNGVGTNGWGNNGLGGSSGTSGRDNIRLGMDVIVDDGVTKGSRVRVVLVDRGQQWAGG